MMMMMFVCVVNGARVEVWKKIYDHWELGNHGFTKECRMDPCDGCGTNPNSYPIKDEKYVQCTNNNITSLSHFIFQIYIYIYIYGRLSIKIY